MWDQARKEARKLEGELDVKLAAFAKLCANMNDLPYGSSAASSANASHQMAASKAKEIDTLLSRLSDVNAEMGSLVTGRDARQHTLVRHRDILQEFQQEFRRLSTSLGALRDREELLSGTSDTAPLLGVQVQSSTGMLLRERTAVTTAANQVDDLISQAQQVGGNLSEQRRLFDTLGSKLTSLGSKFPVINSLLSGIHRKKHRDTLILAAVVAVCTVLLLAYWLSK